MSETPKFSLLQRVRNTVASESNPHRDGWFLRTITRPHGRMNSGRWAVVLHADGTESHTPPENLVPITEEAGAMSDHPRDCPHGRQWGKCDTCDLATAHERIIGLVDENKQLQAERDYAALEYKREHALRLEIEAEMLAAARDAAWAAERRWQVESLMPELCAALEAENERLRAVAREALDYTDYVRPLGPRGQALRDAALAALDEEVGK